MQPSPLSTVPNPAQQNIPMDQQQHLMPGQQSNMIRGNNGTDYHKQNQQMNQPYVGQNQNPQMVYNNAMQVNRFGLQQPNRSMMFPQTQQQPSPNSNSALISQLSTPPSIQGPGSEYIVEMFIDGIDSNKKIFFSSTTKSNDKCSTVPNAATNATNE